VKVKELSLLIVDEDQTMRQLLASLVSDRYRAVTAGSTRGGRESDRVRVF